ncbi:MAG: hypothetical protein JXQ27_01690 [Acidobacteria bacterium]|nr:hypothetical protein [Acidobacteriota bacterium]
MAAIACVLFLLMSFVIGYALIHGNFNAEGNVLTGLPWGIVSLVDLYTGFTLFVLWIFFRERSVWAKVIWMVAVMALGFAAGSLYVFVTALRSGGDWRTFWMGARANHD